MRRLVTIVFATTLLFASFATQMSVNPASAASLSPGCAAFNALGTAAFKDWGQNVAGYFNAGEVVVATNSITPSGPDGLVIYGVDPNGNSFSIGVPGVPVISLSYTIPISGYYGIDGNTAGPANGSYITVTCYSPSGIYFGDGRLNAYDANETFALYCNSGVIVVWTIDPVTSAGKFAFSVTPAELAKFPTKPTVNTAIKSGGGATLYRLTTGELQVNRLETTGKTYAYIFNGCPSS